MSRNRRRRRGASRASHLVLALAAAVLAAACGGGSPNERGPELAAENLVLGPSQACDRDLAAAPADVTVYGAEAGDYLADRFSVAGGDFNGDGLGDVLLGAPLADGPDNSRSDAGEAYVIFGAKTPPGTVDLAGGAAVTIFGERPSDNLGFTVAAGDVNGDGVDDILVGARFAAAGSPSDPQGERGAAGRVYVILGGSDPAPAYDTAAGDYDSVVLGPQAGAFLGIALATGDVNGDGADDLLLGASGAAGPAGDRPNAGAVHVVLGGNLPAVLDLAEEEAYFTVYGANPGDTLPNHLAAGDIDGDGREEVIIGAPFVDGADRADAGRVYVVRTPGDGGTLDLAADDPGGLAGAAAKDQLGFQVAAADVNGDGRDDIIAGARDADGLNDELTNAGEVHVLLGAAELPGAIDLAEESPGVAISAGEPGDTLGFSVAAGDLNGDSLADVLAGAPLADGCGNARPDAGDAFVLYGRDRWPQAVTLRGAADRTYNGAGENDNFGFSLAVTDFNGDGRDDVLAGALLADGPDDARPDAGELYIILSPQ